MTSREELLTKAQYFVDCKYVARADERQKSMGLAYVEAERQDLAREMVNFTMGALSAVAQRAPKPPYPADVADKKLATDWYTWGFQAGMDAARSVSAQGAPHEAALRDIVSWKEDTLGPRPKERGPYDCAPEITEAFDRGVRMAFYRCAARASEALSAVTSTSSATAQCAPKPDREAIANAIRLYCKSMGSAAVQVSSDGIERIYYVGLSLSGLTERIHAALTSTER